MKKKLPRQLLHERIDSMLARAQAVAPKDMGLANRYVTLARKLAMKNRLRLSQMQKRQFCSHCYKVLVPGLNSRTRITGKTITVYCSACKGFSRYGYRGKK